jgi:hypothetical protein
MNRLCEMQEEMQKEILLHFNKKVDSHARRRAARRRFGESQGAALITPRLRVGG